MEIALRVMPLTRLAVDALGVVTICLVSLLVLIGLFCISYTLYFRFRIQRSNYVQLGYFNGPWVVRIAFNLLSIWWAISQILRLPLLRQDGRILGSLGIQWQEDMCKYYMISNLGFTEPCLMLTMFFLVHASLQWREILNQRWNLKTMSYVFLCTLPILVLDLIFVLFGPKFERSDSDVLKLPRMFTGTSFLLTRAGQPAMVICTYPLLCTILHGLFAAILTSYLLLLGRQMASSVINKKLRMRVCSLILLVSSSLPSMAIFLGFSVMAKAHFLREALAFSGFFLLFSCVLAGTFVLVYLPVADSLALSRGLRGSESGGGGGRSFSLAEEDFNESISLIAASQGPPTTARTSNASTKQGSISFRTMIKGEGSSSCMVEEEMTTFSLV